MSTLQCLLAPYLLAAHLFPDTLLQRQQRQHHPHRRQDSHPGVREALPPQRKRDPRKRSQPEKPARSPKKKVSSAFIARRKDITVQFRASRHIVSLISVPSRPIPLTLLITTSSILLAWTTSRSTYRTAPRQRASPSARLPVLALSPSVYRVRTHLS